MGNVAYRATLDVSVFVYLLVTVANTMTFFLASAVRRLASWYLYLAILPLSAFIGIGSPILLDTQVA